MRRAQRIAALGVAVAACSGSASPSPSATASTATSPSGAASPSASAAASGSAEASGSGGAYELDVASGSVGKYLTGEDGKTLYTFKPDTAAAGKSTCNGDCSTTWPPFVLESGETAKAGAGVTGAIATITRDDGAMQVTYKGAPLYYFSNDTKAGDTNGQGTAGVWFVAAP